MVVISCDVMSLSYENCRRSSRKRIKSVKKTAMTLDLGDLDLVTLRPWGYVNLVHTYLPYKYSSPEEFLFYISWYVFVSCRFYLKAERQKNVFEKQLKIAVDMNLPIVIHCRDADIDIDMDAEKDCIAILKKVSTGPFI